LLTSLKKWEIFSTLIFIAIICVIYVTMKWMKGKNITGAVAATK